jgi:glutamate--cysteine ligase
MALPAFWVGLLYDASAQAEAYALISDWTQSERQAMRDQVPRLGLATPFRGSTVGDVARQAVAIAEGGLKRRAALSKWEKIKEDYPLFIRKVAQEKRGPHHSEGEL